MKRFVSWRAAPAILLAVPALLTTFLSAPASAVTQPAPVSGVGAMSWYVDYIDVTWVPSISTRYANACYLPGPTAPDSPTGAGVTCLGLTTEALSSFQGTDGQVYSISVFSYDPSTSTYGSGASVLNVVATDAPPFAPTDLTTAYAGVDTALYLDWREPIGGDVKDYLVSWAPGTDVPPPPSTEDAAHVTRFTSLVVEPLPLDVVYTFAVRARDFAGHVGPPVTRIASARRMGISVVDDSTGVIRTTQLGESVGAAAAMPAAGAVELVTQETDVLVYLQRNRSGWTGFSDRLSGDPSTHDPFLAAASSAIAAAWTANDGAYCRFKASSTAKWGSVIHPMGRTPGDRVAGLALDSQRHIHLLVVRTKGAARGVWYVTNTSGRWTRTLIAGTSGGDVAALTRDPATNRIVVVDRHRTSSTVETVRVAAFSASATGPGTFRTWLSTRNRAVHWRPTSVAAYGGTFTVALQRAGSPASGSDGPYVLAGTATTHRSAVRVGGTTSSDTNVSVTMPTAKRAVFIWQRHNATWDTNQLGVWTVMRSYSATVKTWTFALPRHWGSTAYDRPVAAFMDTKGHTYVVYNTVGVDVTE